MKPKWPEWGEMVIVKVLIPEDYSAPKEFHDCHGMEFTCAGIRFEDDMDGWGSYWAVWVFPELGDLHDKDILGWEYLPKITSPTAEVSSDADVRVHDIPVTDAP